jgi:hypothetical protein
MTLAHQAFMTVLLFVVSVALRLGRGIVSRDCLLLRNQPADLAKNELRAAARSL